MRITVSGIIGVTVTHTVAGAQNGACTIEY